MLPLQQAYEVKEAIRAYIKATFRLKDQDADDAFCGFIENEKHGIAKGPYTFLSASSGGSTKSYPPMPGWGSEQLRIAVAASSDDAQVQFEQQGCKVFAANDVEQIKNIIKS